MDNPQSSAPDAILLAVAVHDEGEARLEPAAPERIRVQAGKPLRFRISYRLADTSKAREDAIVEGELRLEDEPPLHARVAMRDRPIVDDARLGDLEFNVRSLARGLHTLRFRVRLETSDQGPGLRDRPTLQSAGVDGSIDVEAV